MSRKQRLKQQEGHINQVDAGKERVGGNKGNKGKGGIGGTSSLIPGITAPPIVPNKDLFHRVNFAVQASVYLNSLRSKPFPTASSSTFDTRGNDDIQGIEKVVVDDGDSEVEDEMKEPDFGRLARSEMKSAKKLAIHNQVKCDPSFKRIACKKCATILIPGLTCRVRVRPSPTHLHVIHHFCFQCQTRLCIPAPPTSITTTSNDQTNSTITRALDGPKRAKQRAKVVERSKVAFHDREGEGTGRHTIWRGEEVVLGWGEMEASTTENENHTS